MIYYGSWNKLYQRSWSRTMDFRTERETKTHNRAVKVLGRGPTYSGVNGISLGYIWYTSNLLEDLVCQKTKKKNKGKNDLNVHPYYYNIATINQWPLKSTATTLLESSQLISITIPIFKLSEKLRNRRALSFFFLFFF